MLRCQVRSLLHFVTISAGRVNCDLATASDRFRVGGHPGVDSIFGLPYGVRSNVDWQSICGRATIWSVVEGKALKAHAHENLFSRFAES